MGKRRNEAGLGLIEIWMSSKLLLLEEEKEEDEPILAGYSCCNSHEVKETTRVVGAPRLSKTNETRSIYHHLVRESALNSDSFHRYSYRQKNSTYAQVLYLTEPASVCKVKFCAQDPLQAAKIIFTHTHAHTSRHPN